MRAGRLRHRILVEEPTTLQNETGEEVVTFSPIGRVWGAVEPLRGREQLEAAQILASMDTRIRIRWSPNVDRIRATWRCQHQGVVYNIDKIIHVDMARREIELGASSGKNDG